MAIKGKVGRGPATRPCAPAGPVPVPVPFVRRRWVQLTAAFVAGLLIFMGGVWLTNSLRDQDDAERDPAGAGSPAGGDGVAALVQEQVGALGTVTIEAPPAILPRWDRRSRRSLEADRVPQDAVRTLRTSATDAKGRTTRSEAVRPVRRDRWEGVPRGRGAPVPLGPGRAAHGPRPLRGGGQAGRGRRPSRRRGPRAGRGAGAGARDEGRGRARPVPDASDRGARRRGDRAPNNPGCRGCPARSR